MGVVTAAMGAVMGRRTEVMARTDQIDMAATTMTADMDRDSREQVDMEALELPSNQATYRERRIMAPRIPSRQHHQQEQEALRQTLERVLAGEGIKPAVALLWVFREAMTGEGHISAQDTAQNL